MQWEVSKSDEFRKNLRDSSSASDILPDKHFHGHLTVATVMTSVYRLINISRIQHSAMMLPFFDSWTLQNCTEAALGQIFINSYLGTYVRDLLFTIIGNF